MRRLDQNKCAGRADTIPDVPVLFWSFRIMAGLGLYFIVLFGVAFVLVTLRKHETRWFLWVALFSLPLPWGGGGARLAPGRIWPSATGSSRASCRPSWRFQPQCHPDMDDDCGLNPVLRRAGRDHGHADAAGHQEGPLS